MGVARPIPRVSPPEAERRLQRLRAFAWLLDRSIPIGGGWRVGLDPLIGLVPGLGDWAGAACAFYVVYEAARLGVPFTALLRMMGNILVEAVVGAVPVLGDLFDFAWQANMRNLVLIERHYRPGLPARSLAKIGWALAAFGFLLFGLMVAATVLFWQAVFTLAGRAG